MLHTIENLKASKALEYIKQEFGTDYTYVILGRSGPTGKTWLRTQLIEEGYNAVELSEDAIGWVDYRDDKNHFIVNRMQKMVIVVLNRDIRSTTADEKKRREERDWDEWKNELPSKFCDDE